MRNLLFLVFVSSLLIGLMSCTATERNVISKPAGQESEVRIYEVFGMDCPGCHGALEKLVEKIQGVQQAEANWKEKQLAVTVRPGAELNDDDIYDAIQRANFTVGERIQ